LGYAYSVYSFSGTGFRFPGYFRTFCGTASENTEAAVDAIVGEIRKMTEAPVTEAEINLAKDGILNSEVFNFDTKREILDRLAFYEMNGYPADFLQQYQEQVRTLTPEKLLEACQTLWNPDDLTIVVVGNRAEWDGDLSKFGAVNEIDITIPEPTLTMDIPAATPEALAQGQSVMTAVAEAMGGAQKLATITGWHEEMVISAEIQGMAMDITITKTVALPDRIHSTTKLPFGEMTQVINGDLGWTSSAMGSQDMTADDVAGEIADLDTEMLTMLSHLDRLQCQALEPVEMDGHMCHQVYITGAGDDYVLLFIDQATSLPYISQSPSQAPMTGAPVTQQVVFQAFGTFDGFQQAKEFTIKHDGELFATGVLNAYVVNPEVDDVLFQK
ncbi:MAG: insulinase family protein, partial [bacterium]